MSPLIDLPGLSEPEEVPQQPVPPPVPEPEPEAADPGSDAGGALVPALVLPGRTMTSRERFWVLAVPWFWRQVQNLRRPGTVLRHVIEYQPDTLYQHRAYLKSRAWAKGHEDTFWGWAGVVFGVLVGRPLKVTGKIIRRIGWAIDGIGDRPTHFVGALFLLGTASILLYVYGP